MSQDKSEWLKLLEKLKLLQERLEINVRRR